MSFSVHMHGRRTLVCTRYIYSLDIKTCTENKLHVISAVSFSTTSTTAHNSGGSWKGRHPNDYFF